MITMLSMFFRFLAPGIGLHMAHDAGKTGAYCIYRDCCFFHFRPSDFRGAESAYKTETSETAAWHGPQTSIEYVEL